MTRRAPLLVGAAALALGAAAAVWYAQAGLAISHFDARAHLVVARRILDSLTPGWQQIGAVWLPLPHLLNMLPVQVDAWYRTGASAIAISVLSSGVAAWAVARLILAATGSALGGAVAAALLLANPNLLYIQSTPMTEPLLLGTAFLSLALVGDWIDRGAEGRPTAAGLALAAMVMTRYEGWLIAAAAIALAGVVHWRRGAPPRRALAASLALAAYPAVAIFVFTLNSRYTIGSWFIPRDFYVPENDALGRPWLAWTQVRDSVHRLSGPAYVWPAYAGAALIAASFARARRPSSLPLLLAMLAAAALPWYAYLQGHPVRVRYGLIPVAACAAIAGAGVAVLWRPLRPAAAAVVLAAALLAQSPLDRDTPLVAESRRDAANAAGRTAITDYLLRHRRDGEPIMMSMGSLGHYMHDLGRAGFDIHDFLHEGNGEAWAAAMQRPRSVVRWVIVEERSEGGDALFQARRRDPRFLDGFARVAAGGGAALYRKDEGGRMKEEGRLGVGPQAH